MTGTGGHGSIECDPEVEGARLHDLLVVEDTESAVHRARLRELLDWFGLEYDFYLVRGTNFHGQYNGIGRREDRPAQPPRPPLNGATAAQLEHYNAIWYAADLLDSGVTLSDRTTFDFFGGQPSQDQQTLETWLGGCSVDLEPRLLILTGYGWASDVDQNTDHGPDFLANLGVDVTAFDYEDEIGDLRRCARVVGSTAAPAFDGEVFGTGCPDDLPADIFAAINGGEVIARYADGKSTVDCQDDAVQAGAAWAIRRASGPASCQRSFAVGSSLVRTHDVNCVDSCLFDDWTPNGDTAQLLADMFAWAGFPLPGPGSVTPDGVPSLRTELIGARPNPMNPAATIRFALAERGRVELRVFDAAGRLVRVLVDEILESDQAHDVRWDGRNDNGARVSSGVYFYQLEAPGYAASRKLVVLK